MRKARQAMDKHLVMVDNPAKTGEHAWWQFEVTDLIGEKLPKAWADYLIERSEKFSHLHECLTAGEIEEGLAHYGSNARLQFFAAHAETLSTEILAELLPKTWVAPNLSIGGPMGVNRDMALHWLSRTGYLTDDPTKARPRDPKAETVVYHGVPYAHMVTDGSPNELWESSWDSLCWTTDREVAHRFAEQRCVLSDTIVESRVLARFYGRNEFEVVFDPLETKTWQRVPRS